MSQLGIVLSSDYIPASKIIEFSPMIDQLGYDQISVPEIWGHDAISLLSVLAHTTNTPRIATGIVNMFSRTPATMAMTAASIDEISDGRFVLGLGVSGPKVIENWHGMNFTKPLTRTEEYVDVVRKILRRERLDEETTQLGNMKDFKISIRDIREDIPIHIAALGPKNMELTAKIADGWLPVIMPRDSFAEQVDNMHENVKKAGKDPGNFAITPFIPTLVGSPEDIEETLKGHLAYYFGGMGDFYNNMLARFGYEEEAENIKDKWQKNDIKGAREEIHDELLDQIAIHGSPDHALEQLAKFKKAGATCPLLTLPYRANFEQGMRTFKTLAPANENI